jgi:hypothetical protein
MDAGEGSDAERDVALRNVNKPIKHIFCEDARGREFFKKLASRLAGTQSRIKVTSFKGPFDVEAEKAVKSAEFAAHKIIVVLDAHGEQGKEAEINNRLKHVVSHNCKVDVIVCENSIEDWLVANECVELRRESALDYLKRERGYEKRHLPGYADRIDAGMLARKSSSFRRFYESLLDP